MTNPSANPGLVADCEVLLAAKDICRSETQQLREITPDRFVSCHRAEELELAGVTPAVDSQN